MHWLRIKLKNLVQQILAFLLSHFYLAMDSHTMLPGNGSLFLLNFSSFIILNHMKRMFGPPLVSDLQLRTASQWAVLSRDLVIDMVDQVCAKKNDWPSCLFIFLKIPFRIDILPL